jgi:hypothetical protein
MENDEEAVTFSCIVRPWQGIISCSDVRSCTSQFFVNLEEEEKKWV